MPFFSVVIPAYNVEAYIGECLHSVSAQSFSDYEVVIVDDGSHDETASVVERWCARHPDKAAQLIRQDNKGIGGARNAGIRLAIGEFVAFLDSDDSWFPNKLERVAEFISKQRSIDLVCHDESLVRGAKVSGTLRYGPYTKYEDLLFIRNCLSTSAVAVRRSWILDTGGFSEDLRFNGVEDYDLWLRLARSGCRFDYLHEVLGHYRVHEGGTTRKVEEYCERSLNLLAAHFRNFPKTDVRYNFLMRRRRAGALRSAGRVLMEQKDRARARQYLRKSVREDPASVKTWALTFLNEIGLRV